MKLWVPVLLVSGQAFLLGADKNTETPIRMKDLPPAVTSAVVEQAKGAVIKGLAKEVENGKVFYEAQLLVNGKTRDVLFDETGNVVVVEEEIALAEVPSGARSAIEKAAAGGKLLLVECVKQGGATNYEAHFRKGKTETELKVDANGKPVK